MSVLEDGGIRTGDFFEDGYFKKAKPCLVLIHLVFS